MSQIKGRKMSNSELANYWEGEGPGTRKVELEIHEIACGGVERGFESVAIVALNCACQRCIVKFNIDVYY